MSYEVDGRWSLVKRGNLSPHWFCIKHLADYTAISSFFYIFLTFMKIVRFFLIIILYHLYFYFVNIIEYIIFNKYVILPKFNINRDIWC